MAISPTLDIASLLIPVTDEQPAGPELRYALGRDVKQLYLDVRDSRKKAIDAERRIRDFALMSDEEKQGNRAHRIQPTGKRFAGKRSKR